MSAIDQGLQFLQQLQLSNGSFYSLSSPKIDNFAHSLTYSTTFTTSLILISLQQLKDYRPAQSIISKGCQFLLTQVSDNWSFNYWSRNSAEYTAKPYPDDLDDTFLALSALTLHQAKIFTGAAMAQIVQLLTATEQQVGGPYQTWLTNNPKWKNIDPTVNAAIGYFLYLHGINLPNLDNYFLSQLKTPSLTSTYYPSTKPFYCILSRFFKFSTKINNSNNQNPLETALDCITLLNNGQNNKNIEQKINFILQKQLNGGWPAYGYCFDPSINNQTYYNGSAALTTAFCLEALALYNNKYPSNKKTSFCLNQEDLTHHQIIAAAKDRFSSFDADFQSRFIFWLEKINNFDHSRQITLLPYRFFHSLAQPKAINNDLLLQLGLANLFGWIAYTIYDDFLDNQANPIDLPIANSAFRLLIGIYTNLNAPFDPVINQIEQANFWEISRCRNPNKLPNWQNYQQLANRSFGHALGPLTLLITQGYSTDSPKFQAVSNFFRHYLIAKQLLDDAHDWEKDLAQGHITPVISLLLARKHQVSNLSELFWQQTLDQVCKLIFKHCKAAKNSLKLTQIFHQTDYLEHLINKLAISAEQALKERDSALQFLNSYQHHR